MEAIYAIDSKNGLAKNGIIPWKSKKDMSFFMNKTIKNIVIMGKNTYFSIPDGHRPLKNRLNIVFTSNSHVYENDETEKSNVIFTDNINIHEEILTNTSKYYNRYKFLNENFKIFIIGGKTIYEHFIPLCDKIWVTRLKCDYHCDLFIHYDYSKQYHEELYEEDDELEIIEYIRFNCNITE
jgi:dihydrofolate reductase